MCNICVRLQMYWKEHLAGMLLLNYKHGHLKKDKIYCTPQLHLDTIEDLKYMGAKSG